jgi:NTE family protein
MPEERRPEDRSRRWAAPVRFLDYDQDRKPEDGLALCLSGGGYRAMLFHLGAVWRLYECGLLGKLDRISSVSGGSITAAVLALAWDRLKVHEPPVANRLVEQVVTPIRKLARITIDRPAIIRGLLWPGRASQYLARAYREHLLGAATLQDLPDRPRFVFNATNVQTGSLWRFSKPYMADYQVGMIERPRVPLATVAAASSAFPPFLSPLILELNPLSFTPRQERETLRRPPFNLRVVLSDGGVYDNLGLETAWKRYRTILVSDGGQKMSPQGRPKEDWPRHTLRVLSLIDNQVRSLRKRQLIASYQTGDRSGAYWGIRSDIDHYDLPSHGRGQPLSCTREGVQDLADTPTRLSRLSPERQRRLINWGYAVCDAALRRHYFAQPPSWPAAFPYPGDGV